MSREIIFIASVKSIAIVPVNDYCFFSIVQNIEIMRVPRERTNIYIYIYIYIYMYIRVFT